MIFGFNINLNPIWSYWADSGVRQNFNLIRCLTCSMGRGGSGCLPTCWVWVQWGLALKLSALCRAGSGGVGRGRTRTAPLAHRFGVFEFKTKSQLACSTLFCPGYQLGCKECDVIISKQPHQVEQFHHPLKRQSLLPSCPSISLSYKSLNPLAVIMKLTPRQCYQGICVCTSG